MADREKTITHLKAYVNCYANRHKICNRNCVLYGHMDCVKYAIESINDALELLKEQEPIKPIRHENWWECPSCGTNLIVNMKYCYGCGKKVKWDGYAEGR